MENNIEPRQLFAHEDQVNLRRHFAEIHRQERIRLRREEILDAHRDLVERYENTPRLFYSGCHNV